MSLSSSEIGAVLEELTPFVGSRVDAVRVHGERSLSLELYGRAGGASLLVSAEADLTRIHLVERRPPRTENPLPFQVILRREIEGSRLARVEAKPGDRVVELAFEGEAGPRSLVAELTGRHGNVFLLREDGTIVASAGRNLSQRRELVAGRPYVRPDAREERESRIRFAPLQGHPHPISAAIEAHYRSLEEQNELAEGRRRLREPVRGAIARARRALEKLRGEAARVPAAEEDRRRADLLKQNLHAVPRGSSQVALPEWTEAGQRQVVIRLDPSVSPRENMERSYRRYRRIVESAERVAARAAEVKVLEEKLLALLSAIDEASKEALPRLEREARRLGAGPRPPPRPRSKRDEPLLPYKLFRSPAGTAILVGRNAEANDALTVRVARGNDLWLHARGRAGSHVVVRTQQGKATDGETLLDAAHLAAHFSDARGEPQTEVVATRAKYVRKVKGSAPGAVTFSQERSILVRMESARIERLLASEEEPSSR